MSNSPALLDASSDIAVAILAVERWSRRVHGAQRLTMLDKLTVPERVAHLMRDVNRSLSAPDEKKDLAFMRSANDLLRNAAVKSQFASFLSTEGLIERLAAITTAQGHIDKILSDPVWLRSLEPKEIITLQASHHKQQLEMLQFLGEQQFEGVSSVISALSITNEKELTAGFSELEKATSGGREKIKNVLTKLLTAIAEKSEMTTKVVAALEDSMPPNTK